MMEKKKQNKTHTDKTHKKNRTSKERKHHINTNTAKKHYEETLRAPLETTTAITQHATNTNATNKMNSHANHERNKISTS